MCINFDYCSKCYGRKERIHEAHEWEKIGPEFVDHDSSFDDEETEDGEDEVDSEQDERDSDESSDSSSTTSEMSM